MDITGIDRSAVSGTSVLHRAAPGAKLTALALVLVAVTTSSNALVLAAVAVALVAGVAGARLDLRLALGLATYPALFAAVFAFASAPSASDAVTIVLKAVTAALAAVVLVLTTPYPQIFSHVQRVLPGLAGDALLMTYRTFFLLAERFGNLLRAVRLRSGVVGGRSSLVRTVRVVGSALGSLVLYAVELAERDYDVLYVRGYEGRLRAAPPSRASLGASAFVLLAASLLAATGVMWRVAWVRLNPFSWLPMAAALLVLLIAIVWRSARGPRT